MRVITGKPGGQTCLNFYNCIVEQVGIQNPLLYINNINMTPDALIHCNLYEIVLTIVLTRNLI